MSEIPWAGLVALVAMFVIPFLPDWLFEGPRTIRHWPRRHVCANCGASWTDTHACEPDVTGYDPPMRGEIIRPQPNSDLERLAKPSDVLPVGEDGPTYKALLRP